MTKFWNGWLKIWIAVIAFFAGGALFYVLTNWSITSWQQKSLAFFLTVMIVHINEEGVLPGGFFYMYNTVFDPTNTLYDRYPINRFSEMLENFLGVVSALICFWFFPNTYTATAYLLVCLIEIPGHIVIGYKMKQQLAVKGKRTIYNPGLASVICGFLPLAVYIIVHLVTSGAGLWQIVGGFVLGLVLVTVCIRVPDKVFMDKNSSYVFPADYGYFNKFLKEEKH